MNKKRCCIWIIGWLVFSLSIGQTAEAIGFIKGTQTTYATELSPGTSSAPGTVISTLSPVFQWKEPHKLALQYQLVVFAEGTGQAVFDMVFDAPHNASGVFKTALPKGTLKAGKKYWWQVKSTYQGAPTTADSPLSFFQTPPVLKLAINETVTLRVGSGIGFQITGGIAPYECISENASVAKAFRQGADPNTANLQINAVSLGATRVIFRDSSGQELIRTVVVQK